MFLENQLSMKWLLLCLHLFFFHFPSFSCFNFLCHHHEYSALLQFKSAFPIENDCGESSSMKTTTWKNGSDCCSWHGVTCDTVSGHVIGLNLGNECLQGILHPNSTLFHLSHLQTLDLSDNDIYNCQFLFKFGGFMSLTHLDLCYCYFEGEVPPQISHLSKLKSLHLCNNNELVWKESTLKRLVQNATNLRELILFGTDMSSIRLNSFDLIFNHSSSLVTLDLSSTGLRGNFKQSILCLPGIQELYMSGNDFRSQLPELSCSKFLRILDFSLNGFQGPIPPSFSNSSILTSLDLNENSLNGSIPSSLLILPSLTLLDLSHNDLSGQIPNSLLILPSLTLLDLSHNDLSGQIPNVFHQSNRFQELYLNDNRIGGELPISLSNLTHLISLSLSSNSLNGQIPDVFGGMTKLQQLNLASNNLEGQIPSSLFNLTQLVLLDCSHNKLSGPLINKISGFQKLIKLNLEKNLLNGTIPSSLLSLPCLKRLSLTNNRFIGHISAISSYSLQELNLCGNKLQGNIPKSIFNLANLTRLCLSSNNLSGIVDFNQFSMLQNLGYLSLSYNTYLSLNFESNVNYNFSNLRRLELSSVSLTTLPKLSEKWLGLLNYLDLPNNKINGTVPNWLVEMVHLGFLNLSQNLFTSMDEISSNNHMLLYLDLSSNLLHGELSASICNLNSLQILNMAHNKLTGTIPQCVSNFSYLEVLDLQMNKFHGILPSNFSNYSKLQTLNLNDNQLEGHIPKSLSKCKYLEVLNLGKNKIEGNFPNWLQTLRELNVLVLSDNNLHGLISNIKVEHPLPNLMIFDISGNNFSRPLPITYLKSYQARTIDPQAMKIDPQVGDNSNSQYMDMHVLNSTQLYDYHSKYYGSETYYEFYTKYFDSVIVRIKGINSTLGKISMKFASIDMSRNKFEGDIPNIIGGIHALIGLNLSNNRLSGSIPRSMGNLANLESLDLSSNMITGVIPEELSNLNFLEFLDLSNNHLVGEIPQGKQFNTFSNDSYEGNLGLCGFPLTKKCGPEQHSSPLPNKFWSEEKFGFEWKPVAIGYGCGFVFGIGLGYCMFLIGKPRWLVIIFGGQPKRRVRRRTRMMRTNSSTMNQMIQMS